MRLLSLVLLTTLTSAGASEFRRFSDGHKLSVYARPVALLGEGRVLLENEKGAQFETPLEVLSLDDRKWFKEWEKQWLDQAVVGSKLNKVIGHNLFNASWRLWDEKSAAVAGRVKWRRESDTPYSSSYRLYAPATYRFLGARPHSLAAYGDDRGQLARISIVFANKGDSFSAAGSAEDHFKKSDNETTFEAFQRHLREDEDTITAALTTALGEGKKQRFGEGQDRRTVTRWDWAGHAFILSQEKNEYVGLMIVSVEEAENRGRSDKISDDEMRARLVKNIVRKKNGDVYLDNIPMVDQGPKGYCVPATFERAMRYLGVPADMYLLAVAGGTQPGGGTNTSRLFSEVRSIVYRKGRRPDDVDLEPLRLKDVRRTVDKGVPIMWQMCSLTGYNQIANARTKKRTTVTDWEAYAATTAAAAEKNIPLLQTRANFHVCMIIGYNETTNEVAVSDSWGKRYEIRWVHLDEADAVSSGQGFVINL